MTAIALAALLVRLAWDQPYPPAGGPSALGVRCYRRTISTEMLAATVPPEGPCRVDSSLIDAGWPNDGAIDFVARGYNEGGESPSSNTVRFCAIESVEEGPTYGRPGVQVFAWVDALTGAWIVDRSELLACIGSAPA